MEKVRISSTTFVDYVAAQGSKKVTRVRQARKLYADEYSPAADFYRPLREGIVSLHEDGRNKHDLDALLVGLHPRKEARYRALVDQYKRWLGRKKAELVEVPEGQWWTADDLQVRVNPEMALRFKGDVYVVKLYFKKEKLRKVSVAAALHLIGKTRAARNGATPAVLDIMNRNLISKTNPGRDVEALLRAEAASFLSLWNSLGSPSEGAA